MIKRVVTSIIKDRIPVEEFERAKRLATPRITDWNQIKDIVTYCEVNGYPVNNKNNSLILCVIYYLVAEYKLHYQNVKMPIGLRDIISDAFGLINPEMVSYHSSLSMAYAKGKNWREKYERLANDYLESIK